MKNIIVDQINDDEKPNEKVVQTCSDDVFERIGLTKCSHKGHEHLDGCGEAKKVKVNDPYYKKAWQYKNGHLVFINPYL